MDKITMWLVTLLGVLLILPLIGVSQLGTISVGITAWVVPIVCLIIGIKGLLGK